MVKGLHFYRCFLTSGHSKHFSISPNIHPCVRTFTHRRRCQPYKATASLSGSVRVRRLAQGHTDTPLGGLGIEAANFWLPANSPYLLSQMQPVLQSPPPLYYPTGHVLHSSLTLSHNSQSQTSRRKMVPTPPVQPSQSRVPKEAAAHSSASSSLSNLPSAVFLLPQATT